MPSHRERVRRNYRCEVCDGEGRVFDYEGELICDVCDGSGVVLVPKPPVRTSGRTFMVDTLLHIEALAVLRNNLQTVSVVNRSYR